MDFFTQLLTVDSVAHSILILSLIASLGVFIGGLRFCNVQLGIAGVLFAGLLFGHFRLTINPAVMEFTREFGLVLFVYTIGLQVGPGFTASFKRDGWRLNLIATLVVLLGVFITLLLIAFGKIPPETAVGLFSGATTNTPSLAAAQQALKDLPGISDAQLQLPGIGYAVAYPFGIIGIILTMFLTRMVFRIEPQKEAETYQQELPQADQKLAVMNLEVKNANLDGICIDKLMTLADSQVVISRILHEGKLSVALPDAIIYVKDIILVVGPLPKLKDLELLVGKESAIDLRTIQSKITAQRVLVTNKEILGKTVQELNLYQRYGITITRVSRADIELTVSPGLELQFADTLLVVGDQAAVHRAAGELGNSPRQLDVPQIIPIFIGIALGVIVGSFPFQVPMMAAPVKLGLAGGPLIVAILLSRVRRWGPLIWYMPAGANYLLREVGIVLFLACVGLRSGDQFVKTLIQGQGLYWMACAALITFIPIMIVALMARMRLKMNYLTLCGILAGSMTDPPALAFANSLASSNAPSISYATVYPLVMLLRVLAAQWFVLLFVH